jgi:hypothetical protein
MGQNVPKFPGRPRSQTSVCAGCSPLCAISPMVQEFDPVGHKTDTVVFFFMKSNDHLHDNHDH